MHYYNNNIIILFQLDPIVDPTAPPPTTQPSVPPTLPVSVFGFGLYIERRSLGGAGDPG
jgi:hypothetical protein